MEPNANYNREKTIAVLTGLICCMVSLGGTVLGSYHAGIVLGFFAALLCTASYGIADLVVYWAARIDYMEDGNAMEWTAWAVKYVLSLYLLFSGALVSYEMYTSGTSQGNKTATAQRAKETFNDCVKSGGRQSICQRQYDSLLKAETDSNDKKESKETAQWAKDIINNPMFNYIPGILGIVGMIALTLVNKLAKQKARKQDEMDEPQPTRRASRLSSALQTAPFKTRRGRSNVKHYSMVTNGLQSFRFRSLPSIAPDIQVSWRNSGSEMYCAKVTSSKAEELSKMNYTDCAKEIIDIMTAAGKSASAIEGTI